MMTRVSWVRLLSGGLLLAGVVLASLAVSAADRPVVAEKPAWKPVGDYLYLPSHTVLGSKEVQKEIGLTEEQVQKLKVIGKKYYEAISKPYTGYGNIDWTKLSEEERKKKGEELNKESKKRMEELKKHMEEGRKQIDEVLSPEQKTKLEAVEVRMFAAPMLLYGTASDRLKLTDQQKEQLAQCKDAIQKKMGELNRQMQKAQEEANRKAFQVLTSEQVEELKKMKSEGARWGGLQLPGSTTPKK